MPESPTARMLPSGHLLYTTADVGGSSHNWPVVAVPYDVSSRTTVGAGAPILEGYGFGSIGTSYSGKLVMTPPASSESSSPRRLVFLDLEGQEAPFSGDMKYFETVRFSPDGTSVVASVAGDGDFFTTDIDLWVYDVTGSTRRQLTFEYRNENHVWMPDGLHLAFESDRAGGQTSDIFLQRADGSSPAEPFIMTVLTDRVPCVYPMTNRR